MRRSILRQGPQVLRTFGRMSCIRPGILRLGPQVQRTTGMRVGSTASAGGTTTTPIWISWLSPRPKDEFLAELLGLLMGRTLSVNGSVTA